MSEESISTEETNKIRISLGLEPIPVEQPKEAPVSKDSISLKETNALRISLGLKPIEDEPTQDYQLTSEDYQLEKLKAGREEKIKQNLEIAKNKARKRRKVNEGKSILDYDDEEETDDWLNKIHKPTTEKKVIRQKNLKVDIDSFSGLKVNHNLDEFNEIDGEVILTLKDKNINDDDETDELESDLLNKDKKLKADLAKKLKTNKYSASGEEKHLMARYDEELGEVDNDDHFLLNDNIKLNANPERKPKEEEAKLKKISFSLDSEDEEGIEDTDDYAKAKPIKMKKLKKKQSTTSRKRRPIEDDDGDVVLRPVDLNNEDDMIEDDSELRSILALKRLKNIKKNKKKTPEELAQEIKDDEENKMEVEQNVDNGVVIDENTEFLSSIKKVQEPEPGIIEEVQKPAEVLDTPEQQQAEVINDDPGKPVAPYEAEEEESINFSGGLAATLGFLRSKQIVPEKTAEQIEQERIKKELQKKQDLDRIQLEISKRIHEEELQQDSRFTRLTKKEKAEILQRELDSFKDIQDPEEMNAKLANYKPEIKLKYRDEYGRELSQKEAYKQLSHQFHGVKTQSKNKVEKKLKKIEEEKRTEQQPLL